MGVSCISAFLVCLTDSRITVVQDNSHLPVKGAGRPIGDSFVKYTFEKPGI